LFLAAYGIIDGAVYMQSLFGWAHRLAGSIHPTRCHFCTIHILASKYQASRAAYAHLTFSVLSGKISVHPRRINKIVLGKRSITADTTLRLVRYFGNSPQFWLGLQAEYDLGFAEDLLGDRLSMRIR
jgi:addiction module HigA family antidote